MLILIGIFFLIMLIWISKKQKPEQPIIFDKKKSNLETRITELKYEIAIKDNLSRRRIEWLEKNVDNVIKLIKSNCNELLIEEREEITLQKIEKELSGCRTMGEIHINNDSLHLNIEASIKMFEFHYINPDKFVKDSILTFISISDKDNMYKLKYEYYFGEELDSKIILDFLKDYKNPRYISKYF